MGLFGSDCGAHIAKMSGVDDMIHVATSRDKMQFKAC